MEASVEETIPELELTLDYMISLKMYIEEEYNLISDSDNDIIIELIKYLREMDVSDDNIKIAMNLLYDSIDPSKKDIINYYFDNQSNSLSNSFSNVIRSIVMQNSDIFTGDIINPQQIIMPDNLPNFQVILNTNLNNLPHVYIGRLNNINNIINNYLNDPHIIYNDHIPNDLEEDNKNVATETMLDENTTVKMYKDIDDAIKSRFTTCNICLSDFKDEDSIRLIKCIHIFHKDCIDPWLLNESYSCPVCRSTDT
jgi:hypothetical protein